VGARFIAYDEGQYETIQRVADEVRKEPK